MNDCLIAKPDRVEHTPEELAMLERLERQTAAHKIVVCEKHYDPTELAEQIGECLAEGYDLHGPVIATVEYDEDTGDPTTTYLQFCIDRGALAAERQVRADKAREQSERETASDAG